MFTIPNRNNLTMKLLTRLFLVAMMTVLSFSCSTDNIDDEVMNMNTEFIIPEAKTIEIEILELINDHRLTQGLNPLTSLGVIKSQTYSHTDYMVDNNEVSHDYFYQRKNYLINNANANKVSENVAFGYSSAEAVVNAWLNSDGHRANIEGDFTDFDVSAEMNENGHWFYTNIFIKK